MDNARGVAGGAGRVGAESRGCNALAGEGSGYGDTGGDAGEHFVFGVGCLVLRMRIVVDDSSGRGVEVVTCALDG